MKTGEDFRKSCIENNIIFWGVHDCSICDYECGYLFNYQGFEVVYDSGCDCTRRYVKQERCWDNVAEQYNCNIRNHKTIKEYNEFWKFED